jgi:hypothetical protein
LKQCYDTVLSTVIRVLACGDRCRLCWILHVCTCGTTLPGLWLSVLYVKYSLTSIHIFRTSSKYHSTCDIHSRSHDNFSRSITTSYSMSSDNSHHQNHDKLSCPSSTAWSLTRIMTLLTYIGTVHQRTHMVSVTVRQCSCKICAS